MPRTPPRTLRRCIDQCARWKLNAILLSLETGLRFQRHPELCHATALGPEEMKKLIAYADERFIEIIPQIQSLGHCRYWLFKGGQHLDLAENAASPSAYCPSNPKVYELMFELYEEVHQLFRPRFFHIGHDEIMQMGECARCKASGLANDQLLAQDIIKLSDWWRRHGARTIVYADMLDPDLDGGPTRHGSQRSARPAYMRMGRWPATDLGPGRRPQDVRIGNGYAPLPGRHREQATDRLRPQPDAVEQPASAHRHPHALERAPRVEGDQRRRRDDRPLRLHLAQRAPGEEGSLGDLRGAGRTRGLHPARNHGRSRGELALQRKMRLNKGTGSSPEVTLCSDLTLNQARCLSPYSNAVAGRGRRKGTGTGAARRHPGSNRFSAPEPVPFLRPRSCAVVLGGDWLRRALHWTLYCPMAEPGNGRDGKTPPHDQDSHRDAEPGP